MRLHELQSCMMQALVAPLAVSDPAAKKLAHVIQGSRRLRASMRLSIYKRSYWYRLLDSFREDFPGLQAIVGEKAFMRLAQAYLAATPSKSFTMRNLGEGLERWLRANPKYAGNKHCAALDMVRLEWADIEAFDGAGLPLPRESDFLNAGPDFSLRLQPHVRPLRLSYPVDDWRIARRMKRANPKDIAVVVYRLDNSVYYRRVSMYEIRILESLQQGEKVASAISHAFQDCVFSPEKQARLVGESFSLWAQLGWLHLGDERNGNRSSDSSVAFQQCDVGSHAPAF